MVMSPEPVTPTLVEPLSLLKPTEVSSGIRPRQSKTIVRGKVTATPVSVEKVWVDTVPDPSKSIVREYDVVLTC
jgi:hypothetical protein